MAKTVISSLSIGENTGVFSLPFGICTDEPSEHTKTVVCSDNFELEGGSQIRVIFQKGFADNTDQSYYLNVGGTGAYQIYSPYTPTDFSFLPDYVVLDFIFQNNFWHLIGLGLDLESYSFISTADIDGICNEYYLTFSSPEAFTISVSNPGWDGTIEYSTNKKDWITWDGSEISSTSIKDKYALYLRGIENTKITGDHYSGHEWTLTGSNISCIGNIENLLDYNKVQAGNQLFDMADDCYAWMFYHCESLVQAPDLPATTLADSCYYGMFRNCYGLTKAPDLPATTLANSCYCSMFYGCTSLTQAPDLPATTLADSCYQYMFAGTGLTKAPDLPATTLAKNCYYGMFWNCYGLTIAPELPATTLADSCYYRMFYYCTSLITIPTLPATALTNRCYYEMFRNCFAIKISSVQTETYTQAYRIPTSGDGVSQTNSLSYMFVSTGGTFLSTPEINTTYYLDSSCTIVGGDS